MRHILKSSEEEIIARHWLKSSTDGSITHWCEVNTKDGYKDLKICTMERSGKMILHGRLPANCGFTLAGEDGHIFTQDDNHYTVTV